MFDWPIGQSNTTQRTAGAERSAGATQRNLNHRLLIDDILPPDGLGVVGLDNVKGVRSKPRKRLQ